MRKKEKKKKKRGTYDSGLHDLGCGVFGLFGAESDLSVGLGARLLLGTRDSGDRGSDGSSIVFGSFELLRLHEQIKELWQVAVNDIVDCRKDERKRERKGKSQLRSGKEKEKGKRERTDLQHRLGGRWNGGEGWNKSSGSS